MLKLSLDRHYKAAIYLRLSREDGDFSCSSEKLESNSISNQRLVIMEYLKTCPEITFVREYCDERIILGTSQEVLAPQGFPDLVLIFIWPEINGPYGRLIRKCVELSPLPIRRAA